MIQAKREICPISIGRGGDGKGKITPLVEVARFRLDPRIGLWLIQGQGTIKENKVSVRIKSCMLVSTYLLVFRCEEL
jgi:hypothetical protein